MKFFENLYLDKAAKATAAVTGGMIAAPLALGAVGFTAGGVAAGTSGPEASLLESSLASDVLPPAQHVRVG
jgi:hypothetical protein